MECKHSMKSGCAYCHGRADARQDVSRRQNIAAAAVAPDTRGPVTVGPDANGVTWYTGRTARGLITIPRPSGGMVARGYAGWAYGYRGN